MDQCRSGRAGKVDCPKPLLLTAQNLGRTVPASLEESCRDARGQVAFKRGRRSATRPLGQEPH
eukprot:11498957-Heterocapsa_arctica.AAC.1